MNNLNSIFYDHLSQSLKKSLYDDISLGRWGDVAVGDFFIVFNDRLTSIVHIVQLSNGYLTFQLRGLEFKGMYPDMFSFECLFVFQFLLFIHY